MRNAGWKLTLCFCVAQALLWLAACGFSHPALAQGQNAKTTASRTLPSDWIHNGSLVTLVPAARLHKIIYHTPRQGLREVGVTAGTLLFEGRQTGRTLAGTAYQFHRSCKPRGFRVKGAVSKDRKQIVLKGKVPLQDANCKVVATQDEALIFVAAAPQPTAAQEARPGEAPAANPPQDVAGPAPAQERAVGSEQTAAAKPKATPEQTSAEKAVPEAAPEPADPAQAEPVPSPPSAAEAEKTQVETAQEQPKHDQAIPPEPAPATAAVVQEQRPADGASPAPPLTPVAPTMRGGDDQSAASPQAADGDKPSEPVQATGPATKPSGLAEPSEDASFKAPAGVVAAKPAEQGVAAETMESAGRSGAESRANEAPAQTASVANVAPPEVPAVVTAAKPVEQGVAAETTESAGKSETETRENDTPAPTASEVASVAAPDHSPQAAPSAPAQLETAPRSVKNESSGTDDSKQTETEARKVASKTEGAIKPDPAQAAVEPPGEQPPAPQSDLKSAQVAAASVAAPAPPRGDGVGRIKAPESQTPDSLQASLKEPLSNVAGDKKDVAGGNRTTGERKPASPAEPEKMMEIVLRNGRILRIGRDVDLEILARIVTILDR